MRWLLLSISLLLCVSACGGGSPESGARRARHAGDDAAAAAPEAPSPEPEFDIPPTEIGADRQYAGPCVEETHLWRMGNLVSRTSTTYDAKQRPIRIEVDKIVDGVKTLDGQPESSRILNYDKRGRLASEDKENRDSETAAWWNTRIKYTYDDKGRLKTKTHDRQINGTIDYVTTYNYKRGGTLVIEETRSKTERSLLSRTVRTNDKAGRPLRQEDDADGDGKPDSLWTFAYDDKGNTLTESIDRNADGQVDSATRRIFDDDNRLLLEQTDLNGDGTPELSTARTYDRFGNLVSETTDQARTLFLYDCWD